MSNNPMDRYLYIDQWLDGTLSTQDSDTFFKLLQTDPELLEIFRTNVLADFFLKEKTKQLDNENIQMNPATIAGEKLQLSNLIPQIIPPDMTGRQEQTFLFPPEHDPELNTVLVCPDPVEKRSNSSFFYRSGSGRKVYLSPRFLWREVFHEVIRLRRVWYTALILLIGVFLSIGIYHSIPESWNGSGDLRPIATVTETVDAVWTQGSPVFKRGQKTGPDRFSLQSGMVKLTLNSGTEIILNGRGEYLINGPHSLFCNRGQVSVSIGEGDKGYEIDTPFSKFVDRGTEFAVCVNEQRSRLDVIRGRVDLVRGMNLAVLNFAQNDACEVDAQKKLERSAVEPHRFVNREVFQNLLTEYSQQKTEEENRKYVKLNKNPNMLARFDLTKVFAGKVENRSARGKSLCSVLELVNTQQGNGTNYGTSAVRFAQKDSYAEWTLDSTSPSLTFMAVVRIDSLKNFGNVIYAGREFFEEPNRVIWQISNDGRLVLLISRGKNENPLSFSSEPIINRNLFGCWAKVGVVINGPSKSVTHFYDGKAVASFRWNEATALKLGNSYLGNMVYKTSKVNNRNFDGAMATFSVFDQPLQLDLW